jgi:hypothetical protein
MLTIQNVTKLAGKRIFGGWVVRDMNCHPTQNKYMFDIHCMGPLGNTIDRCTVSLNRIGQLQREMGKPDYMVYFINYNGEQTDVCVTKDWILNPENFISQLKYIIKEYHNKQS